MNERCPALFILLYVLQTASQGLQAADGNRTRDLRTTNATLYRLSHSSIVLENCSFAITVLHSIKSGIFCQEKLNKFFEQFWATTEIIICRTGMKEFRIILQFENFFYNTGGG